MVRGSRVPAEAAGKVPAKEVRSSSVQADLIAWEAGERQLAKDREVRTRRTETGSRPFECRPYRLSN